MKSSAAQENQDNTVPDVASNFGQRPSAARIKKYLAPILWPLILAACCAGTEIGMATGYPTLGFNITYACLALSLFALERIMPHERSWLRNDGQMGPDLAHTLLNKGFVQVMVVVAVGAGFAEAVADKGSHLWPSHWPMVFQVVLGLVIAEIGLYAAHRIAHEWNRLWHFHAVHHSAPRLWFFNTGRFHFVDTTVSILLSQPLLFLIGAPSPVFIWVAAFTAYVGMLTHCNVTMRTGVLNYVFNTPELHRWHHSREPRFGNRNYGENLMLFDLMLGTYLVPPGRPPVDPGIAAEMPHSFLGQLGAPFRNCVRGTEPVAAA
jgi:sterol desaturase/sphingolipid hydroxylase (fatty acid hydroxylase superfamily)